jgi:SAM-dependent methyltransferase
LKRLLRVRAIVTDVPRTVVWIDGRGTDFLVVHHRPSESFLREALAVLDASKVAADVGTGRGAVAIVLAPRAKEIVAVDKDEASVREAARAAKERNIRNVTFYVSDLETEPWSEWAPKRVDVVLAHLFYSRSAIENAARLLPSGGSLVVAALGPEQWRETGIPPRFTATPQEVRAGLEGSGLRVEALHHDLSVVTAPGFDVLDDVFFRRARDVQARWKESGRWEGLKRSFESGSTTLTESRVVARATKP